MKDDGGSIYAGLKTTVPMGGDVSQVSHMEAVGGLSIRDWFAGMAVQYYCKEYVGHPSAIANMAFKLADAMLAARKEQQ